MSRRSKSTGVLPLASALFLLIGPAFAQTDERSAVEVKEVLVLLRAGVPSDSILESFDRRAEPTVVTEQDLDRVTAAGGSRELIRRLTIRLETFQRLEQLARAFQVHTEPASGLQFFVPREPRPWEVDVERKGKMTLISMKPDAESGKGWFEQPRILIMMIENTRFPAKAGDAVAERLGALARRHLGVGGFRPGIATTGFADVAGGVGREVRMPLRAPGTGFEGVLGLRTRILDDGTVICTALAASRDAFEDVVPRFGEITRALEPARKR